MIVRLPFLTAGVVALLHFAAASRCFANPLPDNCDNPIVINNVIVTNSICGSSLGVIILSLPGSANDYKFDWLPNVSSSNVASGLVAGAYKITITRVSNPMCTLDTTVVVNNTNGPSVQVAEILPANCLVTNGKVTLSPATLSYAWSNGEVGAVNTNLPSGCYYVTATSPSTGCYSVIKVCVPNENSLKSEFEVLIPAKCGLPTGSGKVNVTGGSGQYSYSFGNSSTVSNLAPGAYTFFVVDNLTGCTDTVSAVMTEAPLEGTVVIKPFNVKCAGQGNGNVEFEVIPGFNFKLPYTFALWDQNGDPQSPGELEAGMYFLQIADADSCLLPVSTFFIEEPPSFAAAIDVLPKTCAKGGEIQLTLNGGNGRYIVDWSDLPGFDNPIDRLNLDAGIYNATVYDSLFCAYPVSDISVPAFCSVPETLLLIVPTNSAGARCVEPPTGVSAATLSYSIVGQSSIFGSWSLAADGCATYQAGPVAKFGVDPIFIAMKSAVTGLSDTVCIIVNITTAAPEKDSVYFAVQAGNAATACGFVPPNFSNRVVSLLDGQGLSGTSDAFGEFFIDQNSACATFESYGPTGYNVDEIGVAVCDTVLRRCHVICYFPTVLSPNDCLEGINLPDSLTLVTANCNAGATACIPIPFEQIFDFVILDNGVAYSGGIQSGCNQQQLVSYTVPLSSGPYQLGEWTVGSQTVSGFFIDAFDLLGMMNQADPAPGWTLTHDSVFTGGSPAQQYGPLKIVSAQDQNLEVQPNQRSAEQGTVMRFSTGLHSLIFRRVQTGCLDTMQVRVICTNCPPVHSYVPNAQGEVVLNRAQCTGDTTFCTNIPSQDLAQYTFTDNGQVFSKLSFCGNNVSLLLDTGFHDIHILHTVSLCEYDVRIRINCSGSTVDSLLEAVIDLATTFKDTPISIDLLENDIVQGVVGNANGLENVEIISFPPNGTVEYDDFFGVVSYTPNDGFCGQDTFSYRITDTSGLTSTSLVRVTVVCDKVLVYNGISPNGDSRNDFWHIVGIEQFPRNEVRVFNRWGNLVFEQKNYANATAWDGSWNGKELPDGTYFYTVDLGDGTPPLSGYLQIMR
jgi:gliding motility-associated-like protein